MSAAAPSSGAGRRSGPGGAGRPDSGGAGARREDRRAAELFRAFEADPSPVLDFLDWLARDYGLPRRPRVLDMGCGTGRVLGPLAARGWRVTGMEPHPGFREAAREAGKACGVPVWRGGFNDLSQRAAFDLIIACNSAFAHLLSPEERSDAVRRCRRALVPGGVLLLDVPNYLWILYHYRSPEDRWAGWRGRRVRLRRRHRIDLEAAVFTTLEEYTVFGRDGEPEPVLVHEMTHAYAMVTYPELALALERAGFDRPATFSSYAARRPEPLAGERMMVAARRAGP